MKKNKKNAPAEQPVKKEKKYRFMIVNPMDAPCLAPRPTQMVQLAPIVQPIVSSPFTMPMPTLPTAKEDDDDDFDDDYDF